MSNIHRSGAVESETKIVFYRGGGAFHSLPQLSQMNGGSH
jgi:hypothetical protein